MASMCLLSCGCYAIADCGSAELLPSLANLVPLDPVDEQDASDRGVTVRGADTALPVTKYLAAALLDFLKYF
jgi:hypothetical protein